MLSRLWPAELRWEAPRKVEPGLQQAEQRLQALFGRVG
jgi:hypothetical protein